jgi:hypothetical protein
VTRRIGGFVVLMLVAGLALAAQVRDGDSFRLVPSNKAVLPCTDPTSGGGLAAEEGSICLGTAGVYWKDDTGDTDWTLLSTSSGTVTPSSTDTFTNKTLDAEGTGNVLTIPFVLTYVVGICQDDVATLGLSTPTSNAATAACVTGTNTQLAVAEFADSATSAVQGHLSLPSDWTGALDVRGKWRTPATSGSVVWQVATICVADAETTDPAFNTASTTTEAAKGTTLQLNDFALTGVTATGCAAGEELYWRFFRDASHGSDDLAATAQLVSLTWTLRRAL